MGWQTNYWAEVMQFSLRLIGPANIIIIACFILSNPTKAPDHRQGVLPVALSHFSIVVDFPKNLTIFYLAVCCSCFPVQSLLLLLQIRAILPVDIVIGLEGYL